MNRTLFSDTATMLRRSLRRMRRYPSLTFFTAALPFPLLVLLVHLIVFTSVGIAMIDVFSRVMEQLEPQRGRILGAEIVGQDAGELIHAFSGPLTMKATVFHLLQSPWYHPTLAEIITYPLEEIAEQIARTASESRRRGRRIHPGRRA